MIQNHDFLKMSHFTAKKLPKNEQSGNASTSGQGRRLVETEGQKATTGNCCKWLTKSVCVDTILLVYIFIFVKLY